MFYVLRCDVYVHYVKYIISSNLLCISYRVYHNERSVSGISHKHIRMGVCAYMCIVSCCRGVKIKSQGCLRGAKIKVQGHLRGVHIKVYGCVYVGWSHVYVGKRTSEDPPAMGPYGDELRRSMQ